MSCHYCSGSPYRQNAIKAISTSAFKKYLSSTISIYLIVIAIIPISIVLIALNLEWLNKNIFGAALVIAAYMTTAITTTIMYYIIQLLEKLEKSNHRKIRKFAK